MQLSLSVILCTHNPRPDYLCRVLASLREQTLPAEQWEFLLIDNASEQPLVERWDISWHSDGKHIREDELGLTAARLRGIQESSGKLLVFVDDDNLLDPDFLEQATAISARFSVLGVFGAGILEPEFEVHPPLALRSHLDLLALRNAASALWTNNPRDAQCRPWGAGLCVSRRVANLYRQLVTDLGITAVLDRRGQRMFSGGDDVFSRVAAEIGLHFGVFPDLRITHLIHAGRLNQRHLLRLIHDHAFSHGVLAYMLDGIQPGRLDFVRCVPLLLNKMQNGTRSIIRQWAQFRGVDEAAQFISENRLKPVVSGRGAHATSNESYLVHYLSRQGIG
jgi:glycosyltransferase involved in cell wall biosynthesis